MSNNDEYISVRDFVLLTGLSRSEIEGKFTVEVGERLLVPRFMTEGREIGEVAHIELPPDPPPAADKEYTPVASLKLDLSTSDATELSTVRLNRVPVLPVTSSPNPVHEHRYSTPRLETPDVLHATTRRHTSRTHKSRKISRSELSIPVNPYRRLTARMADLIWETVLVVVCALWLIAHLSETLTDIVHRPLALIVLTIVMAPIILLVDAVIYTLAGNTPGKSILGLKVVSRRLKTLSFARYFSRNFRMWYEAFAYGILPVSLFYMAKQGVRVSRGLETLYDQKGHTRVGQRQNTSISTTLLGVGFIIVMLALAASIRNAIRI